MIVNLVISYIKKLISVGIWSTMQLLPLHAKIGKEYPDYKSLAMLRRDERDACIITYRPNISNPQFIT